MACGSSSEWYLEQYVFQPLPGVDIGGFTRCYHGIDYCSPAGRCVVAAEEPVLAAQRQGRIAFSIRLLSILTRPSSMYTPAVRSVSMCRLWLSPGGFWPVRRICVETPFLYHHYHRVCLLFSEEGALSGCHCGVVGFFLHGVQLPDHSDGFCGQGTVLAQSFHEFPAHMCPAGRATDAGNAAELVIGFVAVALERAAVAPRSSRAVFFDLEPRSYQKNSAPVMPSRTHH